MKINAIKTYTGTQNKNKNKLNTNFKGYTYKPDPGEIRGLFGDTLVSGGAKMKGDYSSHIDNKVYIASPHEEVTKEIFDSHAYIQYNNLPLSQIHSDYYYSYHNTFAENARCEAKHFEFMENEYRIEADKQTKFYKRQNQKNIYPEFNEKKQNEQNKMDYYISLKNQANERVKLAKMREKVLEKLDRINKLDEELKKEYPDIEFDIKKLNSSKNYLTEKITDIQAVIELETQECQNNLDAINNTKPEDTQDLDNIIKYYEKRYRDVPETILKEHDKKTTGVKSQIAEYNQNISDLKNEIDKLNNEAEKLKSELAEIEEKLAPKEERFMTIKNNMEQCKIDREIAYKEIEKFYREYYPEWCDI